MDINYLKWYIELYDKIYRRKEKHLLLASSVAEPTDLILRHLAEFQDRAREYCDVSYSWGHELLKNAIGRRYRANPGRVISTNGASNGIYLACRALLEKGDHVIVETPCYEPLRAAPAYIGAEIDFLARPAPDYQIDLDKLSDLIRPNTRLIILTNLHNPSGAVMDDQTLLQIAKLAKGKNARIRIIVDEIYHDFLPEISEPAANLDDCFITLNSLTKVYGLGIIHCGWIIADAMLADRIRQLQVLVEGAGSRLLDSFAVYIFENLRDYHAAALRLLKNNHEILSQFVQPLIDKGILEGFPPRQGCIYFPKINGTESTQGLVERLAKDFDIFITPGKFFGLPGNIRLGFGGQTDKFRSDIEKFADAVNRLMKSNF